MGLIRFCIVAALVVGPLGSARANPIPCESFEAQRSEEGVGLTLQFDKACYETAPDLESVTTKRDLFEVDLDYTSSESADYFTLAANDPSASAASHRYVIEYDGGDVAVGALEAGVGGDDCSALEGTLTGTDAELVLGLYKTCFDTPFPAIEYLVERNESPVELSWTQQEGQVTVLCTATDGAANPDRNTYLVGVRVGSETTSAELHLMPGPPDVDAGLVLPVDAAPAVQADANPPAVDDDPGGCATTRGTRGPVIVLLFSALLLRRRRR